MFLGLFWPNHDLLIYLSALEEFHVVLITEALKYILVSVEQALLFLPNCLFFTNLVIQMVNKFTWFKQPKKVFKST